VGDKEQGEDERIRKEAKIGRKMKRRKKKI
jgi:hypothetical protein